MSVETSAGAASELRVVPLSKINVVDGFNPRTDVEKAELDRLAQSIRQHGILTPVVLRPQGGGDYALIAGGRRIAAAAIAGLMEVPAVVRATVDDSDGLEFAVIENIERIDLNPVEEALAFQRLIDSRGLTRRGVAQLLGVSQKLVTERLAILDLPVELHAKIASGDIPPSAVKPLVELAKIHAGLPALAVAAVELPPLHDWDEPITWADLARAPVQVVCSDYEDSGCELPSDVFEPRVSYPVARFELDDKAQKDLAALCKLLDVDVEDYSVVFGPAEVDQAAALGAAYADGEPRAYGATLIVGQDVANQLAADRIKGELKERRARQRREREWDRQQAERARRAALEARGIDPDSPEAADVEIPVEAPPTEEELKAQRRAEREALAEERRQAEGYNLELGAAVYSKLSKVKLDERVAKILAAVDFGNDLGQIAARGARYGFPGWQTEVTKGEKTKLEYPTATACAEKAKQYIAGAKTAAEVAGRYLALVVMARYARETAVAQSNRSFYELHWNDRLPWHGEMPDLVDAIAAERLPDHLTAAVRKARRDALARERKIERVDKERRKVADELIAGLPAMEPEAREQAVEQFVAREKELDMELGRFNWQLRQDVEGALRRIKADEAEAAKAAEQAVAETTAPERAGDDEGQDGNGAEDESAATLEEEDELAVAA
jgi:ParB/RepB/Spo0J family partition protein